MTYYSFLYREKIIETDFWKLVEPEDVCLDKPIDSDNAVFETSTIYECARKCMTTANPNANANSYFAYGTNSFGGNACKNGICQCHCIATCKVLSQDSYWFFRFKPGAVISLRLHGELLCN